MISSGITEGHFPVLHINEQGALNFSITQIYNRNFFDFIFVSFAVFFIVHNLADMVTFTL